MILSDATGGATFSHECDGGPEKAIATVTIVGEKQLLRMPKTLDEVSGPESSRPTPPRAQLTYSFTRTRARTRAPSAWRA